MENISDHKDSLYIESKSFQTIRILNIFIYDRDVPRSEAEEILTTELLDRINKNEEFQHYIDFFLKIDSGWQYGNISFQRKLNNHNELLKLEWNEIDFSKEAFSQPLFIIFGSAFNESIDLSYRNSLQVIKEYERVRLEPISYYSYKSFKINNKFLNKNNEFNKFAVLLFQIADPTLSKSIANPDIFFSDEIFSIEKISLSSFGIVSFGLLRGDMEGYILFGMYNDNCIEKLKAFLIKNGAGFIKKILPIVLFECSFHEKYINPCNLDIFSEVEKFKI
jgi:hypothetical protein